MGLTLEILTRLLKNGNGYCSSPTTKPVKDDPRYQDGLGHALHP